MCRKRLGGELRNDRFAAGTSGNTVGFVEGASNSGIFNSVEYPTRGKLREESPSQRNAGSRQFPMRANCLKLASPRMICQFAARVRIGENKMRTPCSWHDRGQRRRRFFGYTRKAEDIARPARVMGRSCSLQSRSRTAVSISDCFYRQRRAMFSPLPGRRDELEAAGGMRPT